MNELVIRRFFSFLIDVLLIYGGSILVFKILNIQVNITALMICSFFCSLFYFTLWWYKFNGQTPGAVILKIKVVAVDNDPIRLGKLLGRAGALGTIVSPIYAVAVLAVYNLLSSAVLLLRSPTKEEQQTMWDLVSGTVVKKIGETEKGVTHEKEG